MAKTLPTIWLSGKKLTTGLQSLRLFTQLGQRSRSSSEFNPEDVLLSAVREGVENKDYRLLGVVSYFIQKFFPLLHVSRLAVSMDSLDGLELRFWLAHFQMHRTDPRTHGTLKRFKKVDRQPLSSSKWALTKYGHDSRFEDTCLLVHGALFSGKDIEVPELQELLESNRYISNRVLMGPGNRADAWTVLQLIPEIRTNAQLAQLAYCSLETARKVRNNFVEYSLAQQSFENTKTS